MKPYLLIFFCCGLISSSLFSQELAGNYFDVFSKDNLQAGSQHSANDALLDSEGVLWLATNTGLVRWDGQQKRTYNENALNGYFANGTLFQQIYERDSATLVVKSQGSQPILSLLPKNEKRGRLIPFVSAENQQPKGYLSNSFQSPDGRIFATISHQNILEIFELHQDEFRSFQKISFDFSVEKKYTQVAIFQNEIWIGIDEEGVWKCTKENKKLIFDIKNIPQHATRTLCFLHADKKSRLWLAVNSAQNLYQWDDSTFQFLPTKKTNNPPVEVVEEDHLGNLLFISGRYPSPISALHLLQDTTWVDYSNLIHSRFLSVHPTMDFSKSLLAITSDNAQIVEIKKVQVKHFLKEKLPPGKIFGNIIKGINEDLEGNIYFLEEIDGFYKMDKDTRKITPILLLDEAEKPLLHRCGGAVHRDELGNLWFKTCDGKPAGRLVKYNPKTEEAEYFFFNELIRDIDVGEDGKIWVAANGFDDKQGSISYFDNSRNQFVTLEIEGENGESFFPEPRFLWYESKTKIWIGTLRGLVQVNPETNAFKIFTKENSQLENDRIIVIHQDEKGKLILGTYGGGVQVFDPKIGHNNTFTKEDGLTNNYVCGIIPIDAQRYWLSTFNGISYWDTEISLFTNFDKSHGFEEMDFNRYAFHASSDGNIYLGNVNGANQFKTEQLIGQGQPPRIGIAQIKKYIGKTDSFIIQNLDLDNLNRIELSPDVTYLELSFFAYDFKGGKTSKILTRLEGYDNDWALVGKEGQVRYRLLPAGTYQLLVKGYSTQGVPSVNELQIEIISKPYFYDTWWFYLAIMLAVFSIGIFLFRRRIQQIKKEENEKQNIQKRFAALELQALQAQLNPHFIFNALGAIQYYIQVNEVESADVYLTRFAQLMRKYLDGSKEKMITLKNEIELLQIYAELEQLRFDKIFEVEFIVDPALEIDDISLPSMMIQPFVENSVNHGLSPRKDGNGKLEIHFYEKGDTLICEIRDNGIGRKNAKINKRKGHKSRGMTILDEKIQTMKMSGMMDIQINIADWKKENEAYPGTVVTLIISDLLDD